jgi:endonuclease/exonuclease/phosphatase family metal-dependent hydrolase
MIFTLLRRLFTAGCIVRCTRVLAWSVLVFFLLLTKTFGGSLTVATYNILNFPEALGMERLDDLRQVMAYLSPDILVVQEMQSQAGVALFRDSILNYSATDYDAIPFHDGPDTDNALFYKHDNVVFLSSHYLSTVNRDIAAYELRVQASGEELRIYSIHFKASQGDSNESIRYQEATQLRTHLDSLDYSSNVLVLGDFNIYTSSEDAYQVLVSDTYQQGYGRLYDPQDLPGDWHSNMAFAPAHTQSTRSSQLPDGGASGGLDDRFDMILSTQSLLDTSGLHLLSDSYVVLGNDGNHFNVSVNSGNNYSVPSEIADALYYSSDHLPVSITLSDGVDINEQQEVVKVWPNPIQTQAHVEFPWHEDFQFARVTLTNILGQRVYESDVYSPSGFILNRDRLSLGVYSLHISISTQYNTYTYQTKVAVVK